MNGYIYEPGSWMFVVIHLECPRWLGVKTLHGSLEGNTIKKKQVDFFSRGAGGDLWVRRPVDELTDKCAC